jgi:hypothetical protein
MAEYEHFNYEYCINYGSGQGVNADTSQPKSQWSQAIIFKFWDSQGFL